MKHTGKRWLCVAFIAGILTTSVSATDWGLWYGAGANQTPRGEDSMQTLAQYDAYFMGDAKEKKIYLTFDCGYENGNTSKILDILKKHHAPAAFFMVGDFLDTEPELTRRMAAEGHLVGNHTMHHPNMSKVSSERFDRELKDLETKYQQVTRKKLDRFYRPPEGSYTYSNLKRAQDLGYDTILWSVAYADWDTKKQPAPVSAIKQLNRRIHQGAIVLLHVVSTTNVVILDELLTGWEKQGYTFAYLSQLPRQNHPPKTAKPSEERFLVNGKPANFTAYSIGNVNYVKLRDMAAALKGTGAAFGIHYIPEKQAVEIQKGEVYQSVGGELSGTANVAAMQADSVSYPLGENAGIQNGYLIQESNYIQLRELAEVLDCTVQYDETNHTVQIQTGK